jgi:type IV pilus assembly protein PilA
MMKQVQKGFTLIELMIVVAIIGILAAIAIPAYQDYLIRAQVTEGFTMASAAKAAVAETYANSGVFPTNNLEAGIGVATEITGKYVESVTVADPGIITVDFGPGANAVIQAAGISLTPTASANGDVTWACAGTGDMVGKYLPSSCRNVGT